MRGGPLGNMTKLGIGTYGLTGAYGKVNFTEYSFAIRYALDAGVCLVDTASAYHDAEQLLGIILKDYPNVKVSSKIDAKELAYEKDFGHALKKSCKQTLKHINRETIDFYHFSMSDDTVPIDAVIEALEALKHEGKIQTYGIGNMKEQDAKQFLYEGSPSSILFEYSAVTRQNAEKIFKMCKHKSLRTIGFGITGRGLLTDAFKEPFSFGEGDVRRTLPLFHADRAKSNNEIVHAIGALAKQKKISLAQMAIAWVLSDPRLTYGLMSTSNYLHVIENIKGGEVDLDEDELEYLDTTTFYAEKKLMDKEMNRMQDILHKEIMNVKQGQKQLLDVINIVITRQIIQEEKLLPTLFDLFKLDEKHHTLSYLNQVREEIRQLIHIENAS